MDKFSIAPQSRLCLGMRICTDPHVVDMTNDSRRSSTTAGHEFVVDGCPDYFGNIAGWIGPHRNADRLAVLAMP